MSSTSLVRSTSSQSVTQTSAGKTSTSPVPTTSSPVPITLPSLNITPKKSASSPATVSTPIRANQNGWIHPRMDEIIRRRSATNFDGRNMKNILLSAGFLLVTFFVPGLLYDILPHQWSRLIHPYPVYVLWIARLLLLVNIGVATAPLWRTPDACEDIPLTPSQRELMGLPPMSRPATPQEKEQYVTPPRFSRSNTPRSASSSVRAEVSGSPLSGRGTPLDNTGSFLRTSPFDSQRRTSGSLSPLAAGSALKSGGSERRRLSYTSNRSSPLSVSEFDSSGSLQTPTKGTKSSMGLNNKWLYEKGRGSPRASPGTSRSSLLL
ncbi:hypothetical protein M409DRAFT_63971 [Zasmidium cellare ATCC 36951]|uniref:Nuclear pore complex component n=1 Tax=Zasmidium cellare ATCC 36951 TaxID=1080233 RepID=A0A6A6CV96_ZASCE|nr:uncharacterized protein M409DRAFT_63971 [Zasmidium cellare ATCC 36951]KAF2170965.1 hypothetical protein M409DRAFT_63971 [Zasmidium cellare ATCC 36951]